MCYLPELRRSNRYLAPRSSGCKWVNQKYRLRTAWSFFIDNERLRDDGSNLLDGAIASKCPQRCGFIWAETEHLARGTPSPNTVTLSFFWPLPLSENVVIVWRTVDVRRDDVRRQILDFLLLHPVKFSSRSEKPLWTLSPHQVNQWTYSTKRVNAPSLMFCVRCAFSAQAGVPAELMMVFVRWAVLKPRWTPWILRVLLSQNVISSLQIGSYLRKRASERKLK